VLDEVGESPLALRLATGARIVEEESPDEHFLRSLNDDYP
jgi:hypothetical protein